MNSKKASSTLIRLSAFGIFFYYCISVGKSILYRPLQRMVVGMVIAGVAFMVAGFVQISVQNADTSISSGHAKVHAHLSCLKITFFRSTTGLW